MEANIEVDLNSSASALIEDAPLDLASATADPARVPKALMPTSALFRLSSAISFFLSRVFLRMLDILSDASSLPSFKVSSKV